MAETYLNPVYGREFPDPFVLKFCGEYWAYCTGFWSDGRCFGILHSTDLVHWQELGGALESLPANHPYYWAPEVSYYNGHFYLYYSTGNETLMEIRVAVAEHPAGPFVDSGRRLTHEDFAIDAHVFQDEDESRYLFYATDYPEHTHIGTGTAVDRMLDPFTLAGKPRPVTRARYDWQVYDPHRIEKGGVRWHTIEGPFVLKHKGIYYQMFSGGNWKNISYGVSYATSHSLSNPDEWQQVADGQQVLPILRTIPDKVIGPGHNSVVRGPDNRQLYCVYHRWALDRSARLLAIDPLDWAGERMLILGPSTGPEPVPNPPTLSGFEASGWTYSGEHWSAKDGVLRQENATASAAAILKFDQPYYVTEFSLRTLSPQPSAGTFGFTLHNNDTALLRFELNPARQQARVILPATDKVCEWNLPPDFNFGAYHLLWLELYANEVKLALDEGKQLPFHLPQSPTRLALFTENCPAAFAGFSLTLGWEDRFDAGVAPGGWEVAEQQLWGRANGQPRFITKGPLLEAYELVVNARLVSQISPEGGYGFYPAYLSQEQPGPLIQLKQVQNDHNGWILHYEDSGKQQILPLPPKFDPSSYQQFRFRKTGDRLSLRWENHLLGEIAVPGQATQAGLYVQQGSATFDMVRVTAL